MFVRPRLFPEADTGFRQSQASLIWQELEEEGLNEDSPGLFRSVLRRRQTQRNTEEEDEDGTEGSVRWHRRRQRMSDFPDNDCGCYFVLGTLAAVFALFVNFVYPLLCKLELRSG